MAPSSLPSLGLVITAIVSLLLVSFVIQFYVMSEAFGGRRSVSDTEARQRWIRDGAAYRRASERLLNESEGSHLLPPEFRHLSDDGHVFVESIWEARLMSFILDTWGIDNSVAIVRVQGDPGAIRGSVALEEWASREELEDGWLLVEGT